MTFFDVTRSKAWVMTRRLNHTSHHRGQQMAMLRMLGRDLHSNYGPETIAAAPNHGYPAPGDDDIWNGIIITDRQWSN